MAGADTRRKDAPPNLQPQASLAARSVNRVRRTLPSNLVVRGDLAGIDGRALGLSQSRGGKDLLHDRVLAATVLVDVSGPRADPSLHGGVLLPDDPVRAQDV